jgi:hypothetical protein
VIRFYAVVLLTAVVAVAMASPRSWAADDPRVAAPEGVAIGGAVSNSTIINTVNHENLTTLAMLTKALSDKDISEVKRREAEIKAAELTVKWGFTTDAVAEVFKIVGEQNVSDEKVPAKLIEIATHFALTHDALAALEPDDPHAAALTQQARKAFAAGRLTEADTLLERAKKLETAALGEARRLMQKAQEAIGRHALNLAKMEATHRFKRLNLFPDGHLEVTTSVWPPERVRFVKTRRDKTQVEIQQRLQ